ncbi:MAG: cyclic nucleotide-binding domain-containing protein [Myxococcales bacterium]|nr:cyclic nucleotide-binding domain-containing protein [Myxococcales bacterium]
MRLDELRTQALRYLALGEFSRALTVYERVLGQLPSDLDTRMRIADVLVQIGQRDLAQRVYAAVVFYDLQGGRPLHAVVAMQALADLGQDIAPYRLALAQLYGAGSPRIARVGGRLAPPRPETQLAPPDLSKNLEMETVALSAASVAADTRALTAFPSHFPPLPLLSDLSDRAFARVLEAAAVHRLGHGARVVHAGDPGDAFYMIAAGEVRVFVSDGAGGTGQQELARLGEGAIFGELALINAQPRTASVDVVGSADLIAIGRRALQATAGELPSVAAALEKFTRDRLLRNLLSTSPIFRPFSPQQRIDLIRRFTGHDIEPGTPIVREGEEGQGLYLLLSGEVRVHRGNPPFEQEIAVLAPGQCFGEISLIRGQPTVATVQATRRSAVLFLAREYFARLCDALPEMRAYFEQLTEERLREAGLDRPSEDEDDVDSRFLF